VRGRHRGPDSERACLIGSRRDDSSSRGRSTDDEQGRFSGPIGVLEACNLHEERVTIDEQNSSFSGLIDHR
jgi:hypothetical protein